MHLISLVSVLIVGLLTRNAINAPLSRSGFVLKVRVEAIGAEECPLIKADAPPTSSYPPPASNPPPSNPLSHAAPGNANSGPGSSNPENNEAADIVQAEIAHNDGSKKVKRVEVVGADESAETQHDTPPSPPSPPSPPKPPAPASPAQASPGDANSGPGSSDSSQKEAENIGVAEIAHNDGGEK